MHAAHTLPYEGKESKESTSDACRDKQHKVGVGCRRLWHPEWEVKFLVSYDRKNDTCTYLQCDKKIGTVKKYTLQRHCESVCLDTEDWSITKRKLFVEHAKQQLKLMQQFLSHTVVSSKLPLINLALLWPNNIKQ